MTMRIFGTALVFVLGIFTGVALGARGQAATSMDQVKAGEPAATRFFTPRDLQPGPGPQFLTSTDPTLQATVTEPVILSNESLGLRVAGTRDGRVVGTLVARVHGQWTEVLFALRMPWRDRQRTRPTACGRLAPDRPGGSLRFNRPTRRRK